MNEFFSQHFTKLSVQYWWRLGSSSAPNKDNSVVSFWKLNYKKINAQLSVLSVKVQSVNQERGSAEGKNASHNQYKEDKNTTKLKQ